ncbi:MAG: hypothetical protein ABIA59_00945 [Candidatus Latescibacterota bacterium]
MAAKINGPDEMKETLNEFLGAENIDLTLSTGKSGAVTIIPGKEKKECTASELYPDGWITCARALEMASALAIANGAFGKILNKIDIKVRNCELGCF